MFKDTYKYCKGCDTCQKLGALTQKNDIPLTPILTTKVCDCWDIDFIRLLSISNGYVYVLVAVNYVSKWVEATACQNNDPQTKIKCLKEYILSRFGLPKAIISHGVPISTINLS